MFRCEFAVLLLGRYHLTNYHLVSFEGDSPILQNKEVRSQTIKKVIVASRLDCLTLIPVTRRPPICSDKAKKIKKITKPAPIRFIKFFLQKYVFYIQKNNLTKFFPRMSSKLTKCWFHEIFYFEKLSNINFAILFYWNYHKSNNDIDFT